MNYYFSGLDGKPTHLSRSIYLAVFIDIDTNGTREEDINFRRKRGKPQNVATNVKDHKIDLYFIRTYRVDDKAHIAVYITNKIKSFGATTHACHVITIDEDGNYCKNASYTMDKVLSIIASDRVEDLMRLVEGGPIAIHLAWA